jgi:ubiquitin-conjugating enzyme E2 H
MSWRKRLARDIQELQSGGFPVFYENEDELKCFMTTVTGSADTPYENCIWQVRFTIQEGYPFTSPSVGFVQRIFHPNVDEESGSICLDALNKAWSPSFTIKHIVETMLPFLLTYPNPDDPLNRDAAHLMKTNLESFQQKARSHALINNFGRS